MNPRFPVYIISKGRADTRLTSRSLEMMGVPYYIIVEPQEVDTYAAVIDRAKILPLDMTYKEKFDVFNTELGAVGRTGSGPARNFAWDHSIASGSKFHWIVDDNIRHFYRFNHNFKIPVSDGTIFRCMEDFVLRYKNIGMAGPNYTMFAPRKSKVAPFVMNTRIYSCILIRNDIPFRWRGRYNEDTDLSLRVLKAKWCTVLFNAFLQGKMPTQTVKGGNTDEIYQVGTMPKSQMLKQMHPDVTEVVWRFGRWHHIVDYAPFKKNPLIRNTDSEVPEGTNDYGMSLKLLENKRTPL